MNRNLPIIGEQRFYMNREVEILVVFSTFHLARIKFTDDKTETCVDFCTLVKEPDFSNTISLGLLRS